MDETRNGTYELSDDRANESDLKLRVHLTSFLKERLSRRELLKAGGLASLSASALWALACQPAAPAPTPAKPAAPVKPVAPAATPTPEAKIGKALIGKLEGPEIITDPAKFPKAFKEAPAWAELVKAGKLPAVKERVGDEPLVVKPLKEIGKYGGLWRRGFSGPADWWNGARAASGPDHILFWDYTGEKAVPNIAKGWEVSDGGKTTTVFLRKGMKWSDGQPFTSDDFKFWWEDMYNNKELIPTPAAWFSIEGKTGTMEFPDKYTVRWKFPAPYYLLPDVLAGSTTITAPAHTGMAGMGGYAPAHYLKQFHPKYVGKEALDKIVKEAKFDNWVSLIKFKNSWHLNPDLPAVTPWKTTTPANTPVWVQERQPYSIWVDTEGNQLPYIDKVTYLLGESIEVLNLRAIAGEYDFQARHMDIAKIPVFLDNEKRGGYKLYLDIGDYGGDMIIKFCMGYDADPEVAKWIHTPDFRRALSLGVNRDQINETFWLGTGTPSSVVPADHNKYFPGPEYRTMWSTHDPKKANELLDKLGLDKKDAEGFRLRTDGKGRLRVEVITLGAQFVAFTQVSEMIREQWKKIGIDLIVSEVERSLAGKKTTANETQLYAWNNDGSEHMFTFPGHIFPFDGASSGGATWGLWFATDGKKGKEPEPRMKELMAKWKKAFGVPEEERIRLGKEIWKIAAEDVFIISIIGLGAASMGTRVVKVNMGNIPARQYNSPDGKTPSISRTVTFFYKT